VIDFDGKFLEEDICVKMVPKNHTNTYLSGKKKFIPIFFSESRGMTNG
jgi:hypothetical protein